MFRVSLLLAFVFAIITGAAWAIYGQPVRLVGEGADEIPVQSISFVTTDGTAVPVQEDGDDDDGAFILLFPGDAATGGRITLTTPDGERVIDVPPVGPGQDLIIDLDTGMAYPDDGRPGPSGDTSGPGAPSISFGYTDINLSDLPGSGFGTIVEGGGERALAETDDAVNITGGSLTLDVPLDDFIADRVFGHVTSASGRDAADGSISASGGDVAIAYQDFGPSNATGIFLGPAGLDTRINRDVDFFSLKGGFGWEYPLGDHGGRFLPVLFFDYARFETTTESWVTTPLYNDITQHTLQQVDQDYFAFGVGGTYVHPLARWLFAGLGVSLFAFQSDAEFSSVQANVCGLCGSGNNFTSDISGSTDDSGFGGGVHVFLEAALNQQFSLFAKAALYEADGFRGLDTPISGNDLFIDNDPVDFGPSNSVRGRQIQFGARVRF